jgi:Ni,Fe-hydrogenase III small subunit
LVKSKDWAFGVRRREDLVWIEALASKPAQELKKDIQRCFRRSLHIRHVDAGSCNGCESELQALNNPYYNLHRLGIFFTPSPRFADLLLVTGSVTYAMREALLETYNAMPEPRWVMAMGTCAVSGGATAGGYSCGHGVEGILPVDIYVPGCPPNPAAMIQALLLLLNRSSQLVQGGHYAR